MEDLQLFLAFQMYLDVCTLICSWNKDNQDISKWRVGSLIDMFHEFRDNEY